MQNQELIKTDNQQPTAQEIQSWLISYLSQLLEIDPDKIAVNASFDRYGLDSSATIGMTSDLGDWLGVSIDPGITYDYPTIESLANNLAESCKNKL